MFYKLDDDNKPVKMSDPEEWADWMGNTNRRVKLTALKKLRVSTVFLGLHFDSDDFPMLFETLVFKDNADIIYQDRHATWDDARQAHGRIVAAVKAGTLESY